MEKLKCAKCGCGDSKVIDSRMYKSGRRIRRRRECMTCGDRYTTYEGRVEELHRIPADVADVVRQLVTQIHKLSEILPKDDPYLAGLAAAVRGDAKDSRPESIVGDDGELWSLGWVEGQASVGGDREDRINAITEMAIVEGGTHEETTPIRRTGTHVLRYFEDS